MRNAGRQRRGERRRALRAWPVLAAVLFLLVPGAVRAERVDHIAAAVNHEVVTGSELAFAVALNARFGGAGADRKTLESETLDGLINRRLLMQEARRLKYGEVSDQELAAEVEKLGKRFGSDKAFRDFLDRLDVAPQELSRMLGERLLVERFIEKKVGLFVRVSRAEAQGYFESHAAEYRGRRFPEVQKHIVAGLTEQKIGLELDRYVAELRAKADIRINPRGNGQ